MIKWVFLVGVDGVAGLTFCHWGVGISALMAKTRGLRGGNGARGGKKSHRDGWFLKLDGGYFG